MPARRCFENAAKLAMRDRALTYVEGYCHVGLIPFEHAWVVNDGYVREPTLRQEDVKNGCAYFGVPFKTKYLSDMLANSKYYSLLSWENRQIYMTSERTLRVKAIAKI